MGLRHGFSEATNFLPRDELLGFRGDGVPANLNPFKSMEKDRRYQRDVY
jgi:hypothetical protein